MDEEIDGDTATETAVDDGLKNPMLTEASLTNLFMSATKADTQEEVSEEVEEEPEAVEEPEEEEATEETEPEATEETDVEEEEETEEEEAEEGDVLSKQDKTVKKMRKRIDKATKNWRTAEEKTESLQGEIESLKQQLSSTSGNTSSSEQSFKEIANKADNIEDLQAIYDKAEKAEEWIEDALDSLRDSGEDTLTVEGGKEYTRQDIKTFHKEVKQALKKDIPARAKVFEQRQQYDNQALQDFEFLSDPKSDEYKIVEQIRGDKDLREFLSGRADESMILGWLAEGISSQNAKQSKQSTSGVDKTKDAVKKPASAPKIAPSLGFVRSKVANARRSSSEKSGLAQREIMNKKGGLNHKDLTKLYL